MMTLSNRLKGIILAVGGSIFWGILSALAAACYTVSPRWLLMRWPSAQVVGWAMLIGGAAISLIYPPLSYPGTLDRDAILSLAYICLLGTAISFWAYVSSTKYILPQEASILNAMEPLASIVFFCPASGCVIPAAGNRRHDFDYSANTLHYNQKE
ncbi:MAG: DMT family transporter [Veillonellaceae bacterium]|nr:DMT family transporter [Veillonellaceae bacterium]